MELLQKLMNQYRLYSLGYTSEYLTFIIIINIITPRSFSAFACASTTLWTNMK